MAEVDDKMKVTIRSEKHEDYWVLLRDLNLNDVGAFILNNNT